MTTGGPLRQVIPVARSILWAPSSEGTKRPGDMPFPVFFSQAALSAVHEHLATPARPGQGVLGFLIGDLCECPDTNVSYLVIDAALRLNQAIYGDRTRDLITRLWDRIEAQLEEQKAHLIGWYHTHPPLPLSLTPHDVETHEQYFAEPWQVALLLGTDAAEPAAAFFRSGSDEEWVSKAMPFYELLAPDSIRPDGKKRSFVTWRNYRAFSSATATPKSTPVVKPPSEPKFTPAPPGSPPPPPAPPPATRAGPARPDDTHELKFLTAAEDMGQHAPPPRTSGSHARAAPPTPPPPASDDRHELKFLTAAEDTPPPAPPRRPTPPPQPRVGPPPRPPAKAPPPPPVPPPEPEAQHATEPIWPDEFEEREAEPEQPVEPEPRRAVRRRRRRIPRKVWLTLLVLLLGAGAGGAYWWFQPELPSLPEWSTVKGKLSGITGTVSATVGKVWALRNKLHRSSPQPPPKPKTVARPPAARSPVSTPPAAPAAPAAAAPGPIPPPSVPPSLTRLDVIGDSLVTLMSNFGERAALYARGQLPCAGLARGLTDVENRWASYNTARRNAGALDASHSIRDQILYAKVDSVERRFEQSGCPRP